MGDFGFPDQNLPLDGQRKRPNGRRAGPNAILRRAPAISASGVRRAKAALCSGCKPHPATAPAGSNRSSHGGNEVAEAFD
jgi:hypothetical protein